MDFKITLDITNRFENCLNRLSDAIAAAPFASKVNPEGAIQNAPERVSESEPVNTPPEAENAPEAKSELPTEAKPEPVEVAAQNDDVEPEPVKAPEKKATKKRTSKKAENLPADAPVEPAPVNTQAEPENAPEAKSEPPAEAKQAPTEPVADDPMEGMTIMQASQAILDEICDRGLEMADVNARVRARAAEAGIAYSSITCLVKTVGYREARRVALNEK